MVNSLHSKSQRFLSTDYLKVTRPGMYTNTVFIVLLHVTAIRTETVWSH